MKKIVFVFTLLAVIISLNSCKKKVGGCTDPIATNYNADADEDDGSCIYLTVGQSYQGGVIAYILQSGDPGYDANTQHGLIASTSDQSTTATWGCKGTTISGADGSAIGTGNQNTIDIVNGCTTSGSAAKICYNLTSGGYSDWYLPSKNELNKLYLNKAGIGGFASAFYWSSSEGDSDKAWFQSFFDGGQTNFDKDFAGNVRAIRAF